MLKIDWDTRIQNKILEIMKIYQQTFRNLVYLVRLGHLLWQWRWLFYLSLTHYSSNSDDGLNPAQQNTPTRFSTCKMKIIY